jgi:hypothetical protein
MRVKFFETQVVDDFRKGTKDEERFEAGKSYDLAEPSALRWANRGMAEIITKVAAKDLPVEPAKMIAKD